MYSDLIFFVGNGVRLWKMSKIMSVFYSDKVRVRAHEESDAE